MQRDIKTLLIILRDNLDWAVDGEGLCWATYKLVSDNIITVKEMLFIDEYLEPLLEPLAEERESCYAFSPGAIEPRRKFLDEIIGKL